MTFLARIHSGAVLHAGLAALLFQFGDVSVFAVSGNSWHIPANTEPSPVTMRNPLHPCDQVSIYNGTYSLDSDQSGGQLVYRLAGSGTWTSNALSFDTQVGNNKYWQGVIPEGAFCRDDRIEYYLRVTYTDDDITFLGTSNNAVSAAFTNDAGAQGNPFVFTNNTCNYGNAWHIPANPEPPGAYMRDPPTNGVNPQSSVFLRNGNQFQGGGNSGNQTGGTVYHRRQGSGSPFAAINLNFNTTNDNNKYWVTDIPAGTYDAGDTVEYFLRAAYSDHSTTWLGTSNNTTSVIMGGKAKAQAGPFTFSYGFNLGNAWHYPTNAEPPGATMRNPVTLAQTNQDVYVYNGNQFQGDGNPGNQSGGELIHRKVGTLPWRTNALVFNAESGDVANNKYWRGVIPAGSYVTSDTVEYFLRITYSDHNDTYIGTTNGQNDVLSGLRSVVETQTFTYAYQAGQSASFMWHNNNRVAYGNTVQFWVKIGYAQGIGTNRYVEFASVYYTTNGSAPHGDHGLAATADTRVMPMEFDHMEEDSFEGGDAMWWVGTVSNLPELTSIQYKIGAYKDTAAIERYADYNTSGINSNTFSFTLGVAPAAPSLKVNGLEADYTTTKFFVDEIAGDSQTFVVVYAPGDPNLNPAKVEIFSDVDGRDRCEVDYTNALLAADGVPDGIKPPNGNFITTADTGAYFRAYAMTSQGGGSFVWTGRVSKTGAYRLTARYQTNGASATSWNYYSSAGRRDHALVVSPRKALDMTLYELNTLTVEATAANESGRSTFIDLLNAAEGDSDGYDPFNLEYLNFIQANCLWFQPIHPVGLERTEYDPASNQPYAPGSPYATRDYWAVTPRMGSGNSEASALGEFTNFVAHCDAYTGSVGTINIMLDGVFNHTSWDAVFGQAGYEMGLATNVNDRIGWFRPNWYSLITDYGLPATYYNTAFDNSFATAPDRGDFGKWSDVAEFNFGRYAALVRHNAENNGDYLNEGDWLDPASLTSGVIELWKYFAYYPEYWLKKTGHSGTNSFVLAEDNKGIDALRCDFGQGLPPQCWEYIINRTRQFKWNFVFMAETLDGGVPGYRSNRHFDILNENLVFQFTQGHINNQQQLVESLESRRSTYRGGAVLLNQTSHDEVMPDNDAWVTAARYAAVSAVDGLPMIFYGQEKGIGLFDAGDPNAARDGFAEHELNFGKYVPHFKRWNQLQVWGSPPPFSGGLDQWYGRVNWARLNSPALRSRNRWFLDLIGGGRDARIFAVAKYESAGAGPNASDVVLAFSRFVEHGQAHSPAANTYDVKGSGGALWNLLGLNTNKLYTLRNLASSDAFFLFTNGWPQSGAQLYNNGIYVNLPVDDGGPITRDGAVVQYLKLVELAETTPFDSDNDGLYDGWEWAHFHSLTNAAGGDADGDGMNNDSEFLSGTQPTNVNSLFMVRNYVNAAGVTNRMITFSTEPGKKYTAEYTDPWPTNNANWLVFANTNLGVWIETSGASTNHTFVDTEDAGTTGGPPSAGQRTYRVRVGKP